MGSRDGLPAARASLGRTLFLGWQIFLRDYRTRYRRALFSVFWVLTPMIMITATAYLVARELGVPMVTNGVPYPVTVITGLILWGVFADAVNGPQQMCRRSRVFLRFAPIDYGAILAAAGGYITLNFLIKLPVLIAALLWFQVSPSVEALAALPFLLALAVMGLALGALVAPVSLVYFDIRYGLPFVIMMLLVLTPVLYPMPTTGLLRVIAEVNPIAHLLVTVRDLVLTGGSPLLTAGIVTGLATVLVFAPLSLVYYKRGMPKGVVHI